MWAALRAHDVREILGERVWVAIPGTQAVMPGVTAWRGRAIAVLDLAAVIDGLTPLGGVATQGGEGKRSRTLVAQVGDNTVAIDLILGKLRDVLAFRRAN